VIFCNFLYETPLDQIKENKMKKQNGGKIMNGLNTEPGWRFACVTRLK